MTHAPVPFVTFLASVPGATAAVCSRSTAAVFLPAPELRSRPARCPSALECSTTAASHVPAATFDTPSPRLFPQ